MKAIIHLESNDRFDFMGPVSAKIEIPCRPNIGDTFWISEKTNKDLHAKFEALSPDNQKAYDNYSFDCEGLWVTDFCFSSAKDSRSYELHIELSNSARAASIISHEDEND